MYCVAMTQDASLSCLRSHHLVGLTLAVSTNLPALGHLVHYLDDSYFPNINLKIKWILFLNYETIHSHYIDNILRIDLISSRTFFLIVLWFCEYRVQ